MKRIGIACAGLHAGVLIETLRLTGEQEIALFDDDPARGAAGTLADMQHARLDAAMIGTANVRRLDVRKRVFTLLRDLGLPLTTAIHPTAFVSPSAQIGEGTFLGPLAVVHTRTLIGVNVCIYTGSTIDHDNRIEDHVFIAPGVHTAGQVVLESGAYLGPGCIVTSGCRVGRDSIVGAGSVVLSDIPPRSVAHGTPARVVETLDEWLAKR